MSGPGLDAPGQGKGNSAGGSRARRKLLTAEEAELFELAQAAGTGLDPEVFKILLDLLRMNVAPLAIFQMLRSMCAGPRVSSTETVPEPARANILITSLSQPVFRALEVVCDSYLLGFSAVFCDDDKKNLLLKVGLLPPDPKHGYLAAFIVGTVDDLWMISKDQAVLFRLFCESGRTRTSSAVAGNQPLSDHNSREGSAQRVPRQPSASRLQKTGCPGKSM